MKDILSHIMQEKPWVRICWSNPSHDAPLQFSSPRNFSQVHWKLPPTVGLFSFLWGILISCEESWFLQPYLSWSGSELALTSSRTIAAAEEMTDLDDPFIRQNFSA
jgi:hypothetical protein